MESKLVYLVVIVFACAVRCIHADGHLSKPVALTSNITRNECGRTKLCVEQPKNCDPVGSSECFFTSTQIVTTNVSLAIELSGNSTGYIAFTAGVKSNLSQESNVVFVCGNNNGTFFFRTARLTNKTLVITNSPNVSNIQGLITPTKIQCVFNIPININLNNTNNVLANLGINSTTFNISNFANSTLQVFIDVLQGSTNGTALGEPRSTFGSALSVNLASVTSDTTNATATTVKPAVTSGSRSMSLTDPLSHALLALFSVLTLRLLC